MSLDRIDRRRIEELCIGEYLTVSNGRTLRRATNASYEIYEKRPRISLVVRGTMVSAELLRTLIDVLSADTLPEGPVVKVKSINTRYCRVCGDPYPYTPGSAVSMCEFCLAQHHARRAEASRKAAQKRQAKRAVVSPQHPSSNYSDS